MTKLIHADVTEKARCAYYTTFNRHAHDYPEAFYEEIMRLEFLKMDIICKT